MNQTNTLMLTIFVILGVMLVSGLVVIPQQIEQQSALAYKGGIPNIHASDTARENCVGICAEQPGILIVGPLLCTVAGGSSEPCPASSFFNFQITVTGNNPQLSTFALIPGTSQSVILGAGSYSITVQLPSSVPAGSLSDTLFGGQCKQSGGGIKQLTATGTIAGGQIQSCLISTNIGI